MSKICDYIYLGSYDIAKNNSILEELNIQCVTNVAKKCNNKFSTIYDYISAPLDDDSYIPKNIVDSIVTLMHQYISNKQNLFIHCRMGKSRSVFILSYYLMKYHDMTPDSSYKLIKSKKPNVNMSVIFSEQLTEYHNINETCNYICYNDICPQSLVNRLKNIIDTQNKNKKSNIIDDITMLNNIKETITRHKKVKALEKYLKKGKKLPKGRIVNYITSLTKRDVC